ncbi:MAG: serine hydrolase domain-containing protein, partial [Saprospiraceae bacterium]|nr:serine hydrolase domain-containing protein [Saprospiraceae bacterium]
MFRLLSVLCLLGWGTVTTSQTALHQQIEQFVQDALNTAGVVPGLSVAVVRDGEIFLLRGFGYRDVERQLPVTPQTGFYIASVSKTLMGLAAAQLEHQGDISLEMTLRKCFPEWEFWPPLDAGEITLLGLFSHRHPIRNSGLQYRLAFVDTMSEADFSRVLFDFSQPREAVFQYSNTSINIAAAALEAFTGRSWQSMVDEEVLQPLQMHHTTSAMSEAVRREFAWPYLLVDGQWNKLAVKDDTQMQSAGGHVTTAEDFAQWLRAHLGNGIVEGNQLMPAEVIERVQTSYADVDRDYYKFHRNGYGLGLYQADFAGERLMHHFGGFEGYMAHASFMPERGIGVAAFCNESMLGGRLPHLVAAYIYELLLGKQDVESRYRAELQEWKQEIEARQDQLADRL